MAIDQSGEVGNSVHAVSIGFSLKLAKSRSFPFGGSCKKSGKVVYPR
jgi:hypothetical protein